MTTMTDYRIDDGRIADIYCLQCTMWTKQGGLTRTYTYPECRKTVVSTRDSFVVVVSNL